MAPAALIFPHQLYRDHPALVGVKRVVFVEDPLYFQQYAFHRQKLMLHRASMKRFADELARTHRINYVNSHELHSSQDLAAWLTRQKIHNVQYVDPCDDWLQRRLQSAWQASNIEYRELADPGFLTSRADLVAYVEGKSKLFFTDFYIQQRKRLDILLQDGKPVGGQWSFDPENRKKLPPKLHVPQPRYPAEDAYAHEARAYVRENFPHAIGSDTPFYYATSPAEARQWLEQFLDERFEQFGDYEDAINQGQPILFHSVLTPYLNTGLLTPQEVLDAVLARTEQVPINSLEGFVRQVIGWREFMRLVYLQFGRKQRIQNGLNNSRPLPKSFYDGTTGLEPVDHVIREVHSSAYCHHIERLMVLGNIMLLCDLQPDDVYRWFMEFFIDAYDWVMVPNVYGMSQYADVGFMTTKPYVSGSGYILKMSNFSKGKWCPIWDALYWRFIDRHAERFRQNPRMLMMVKLKEKLGDKLKEHHRVAEAFLTRLA